MPAVLAGVKRRSVRRYCVRRMRVAWFSPLPPVHSGIAAYSVDVLAGLRERTRGRPLRRRPGLARRRGASARRCGSRHRSAGGAVRPPPLPRLRLPRPAGSRGLTTSSSTSSAMRRVTASCGRICCAGPGSSCSTTPPCITLGPRHSCSTSAPTTTAPSSGSTTRASTRASQTSSSPASRARRTTSGRCSRLVMSRARAVAVHSEPLREALAEEFPETPLAAISMGVPDPWENAETSGTGHRAPGTGDADASSVGTPEGRKTRTDTPDLPGRSLTVEQARRLDRERRTPTLTPTGGYGTGYRASGRTPNGERGRRRGGTGSPKPAKVAASGGGSTRIRSRVPNTGGKATAEVVLAAFGVITPEKRILPILRALAAIRAEAPHVRLRLVGEIGEHYALVAGRGRHGHARPD